MRRRNHGRQIYRFRTFAFGVSCQLKSVAFWHRMRRVRLSFAKRNSIIHLWLGVPCPRVAGASHCELFQCDANFFTFLLCVFCEKTSHSFAIGQSRTTRRGKIIRFSYFICCRLAPQSMFDVDAACTDSSVRYHLFYFTKNSQRIQLTPEHKNIELIIFWVRHDAYAHVSNSPENRNSIRMEFDFPIGFYSSLP